MNRTLTSALLAITLTLGCGDATVTQAQRPAQAEVVDQFDAALAAYNRQDYATARSLWQPLAEQGDANAQFNLGFMYDIGQGVAQDYQEAVRWYRLAAEQGDALAQGRLGFMYANGQGIPQDYREAVRWYRLAAEQGSARSQNSLAHIYAEGRGVAQDYQEAVRLFLLAAEQGYEDAQGNLGLMYAKGQGVAQDYVRAHMWSNLGAISGDSAKAASNRDIVAAIMTPAQIAEAQAMARNCQASNFRDCD